MAVGAKIKEERREALERIEEENLINELEEGEPRRLSIKEEKILSRAIKRGNRGSLRARNCFVVCNRGLVVNMAKRYFALLSEKNMEMDDLIQEGNIGLMNALKKFDPEIGKFGTYAVWWVRQAILITILHKNWPIHVPPRISEAYHFQISKAIGEICEKTANPTTEELAELTGLDEEIVQKTLKASLFRGVRSLNSRVGEDEELGSFIKNPNSPDPFLESAIEEKRRLLRKLLSTLSAQDRNVVSLRYGIGINGPAKSLNETALMLYQKGFRSKVVTRERVRQIEEKAIKRLKQKARKYHHSSGG